MYNTVKSSKRQYDAVDKGESERTSKHARYDVSEINFASSFTDGLKHNQASQGKAGIDDKLKHPKDSQITTSVKLANLLESLNELLAEDDSIHQLLGAKTVDQCKALRENLRKVKDIRVTQSDRSTSLAKSVSPPSLTPWTASAVPQQLPPLPEVLDPTLRAGVFIHQGVTSGRPTDLSYERLEWVGDAYLYITSTLLISQTFPALTPGRSSQMRERIVKNVQLAEYARLYGFDKQAVLPEQSESRQGEKTKIFGDMFEAYVAAVILSDPGHGVSKCSEWLKSLWAMTLEKEIKAEEQNTKIDSPLWRLRGDKEPVQLMTPKELQELPAKDRLRKLICSRGVDLQYQECAPERKDPNSKLSIFTVGVYITGWGEKNKKLGHGSALGKKDAGQKAAEMALANTKLMNVYAEKKRLFDAQKALEVKALEGLT